MRSKGTEWEEFLSPLRVFEYITFRSAGAAVTALVFSWFMGPSVIAWLKRLKFGQHYVDKAEEAGGLGARVLSKKGTPTMGGILIVVVMDLSALLWAQWNELVVLTLLSLIVLAGLGFYDDYAKITKQNNLVTMTVQPMANPYRPSVRFTALELPTIAMIVITRPRIAAPDSTGYL